MKTEEIQARLERGYTMAVYGTRENIHEQMTNDIKTLLEAINYTPCCNKLPNNDKVYDMAMNYIKRNDLINKPLLRDEVFGAYKYGCYWMRKQMK